MNECPLLVIQCYNEEKYLPATLASLLAQTYRNFRCIISDNQSSDSTYKIAENLVQHDSRFLLVKTDAHYPSQIHLRWLFSNHVSKIVVRPDNQLICIVGAHDIIAPNYLAEILNVINSSSNVVAAYGDVVEIDVNGIFIERKRESLSLLNHLPQPGRSELIFMMLEYMYPAPALGILKYEPFLDALNVIDTNSSGPDHFLLSFLSHYGVFAHTKHTQIFVRRLGSSGSYQAYFEKHFHAKTEDDIAILTSNTLRNALTVGRYKEGGRDFVSPLLLYLSSVRRELGASIRYSGNSERNFLKLQQIKQVHSHLAHCYALLLKEANIES